MTRMARAGLLWILFLGTLQMLAEPPRTYRITARKFSRVAMAAPPQELRSLDEREKSSVAVVVVPDTREGLPGSGVLDPHFQYDPAVARFLLPTDRIQCGDPGIARLAAALPGTRTLEVIRAGLGLVSRSVTYDPALAKAISEGTASPKDALAVLREGTGTCSEYASLFVALMRSRGIPARYVVGVLYSPENDADFVHAWAECYLPGHGWLGVDPQAGSLGLAPDHIRLFLGMDYPDCGAGPLPQLWPLKAVRIQSRLP